MKLTKTKLKEMIREEISTASSGSTVIALFFDSKKQKNNNKQLYNDIIGLIKANHRTPYDFVQTSSVLEVEVKGGNKDFAQSMKGDIVKHLKNKYTNFDVYEL